MLSQTATMNRQEHDGLVAGVGSKGDRQPKGHHSSPLFQAKPVTQADLEARLEKIYNPQTKEQQKAAVDLADAALRDLGIKVA